MMSKMKSKFDKDTEVIHDRLFELSGLIFFPDNDDFDTDEYRKHSAEFERLNVMARVLRNKKIYGK